MIFGLPTLKQRCGKDAHGPVTVLVYPLNYFTLSCHVRFFLFGILFHENCYGILGSRGTVVKTGVESHPRNIGHYRSTVPAQLSVKSSSQCVLGLNQQECENLGVKNQGVRETPVHCSNGSHLQTQGFLCKIGCEVVLEHKLSSSVMPLLIILCGSKQIFALILLSFPFL